MATTSYLIGLGSNRGHGRCTTPERMLAAAMAAMAGPQLRIVAATRAVATPPLGPGTRRFANAAALIETPLTPPALLAHCKALERRLGRRPGRRWGDRPIDLDLLLWSGGPWRTRALHLPHPGLTQRPFALLPAASLAPHWRVPGAARTLRQCAARLTRRRALPCIIGA